MCARPIVTIISCGGVIMRVGSRRRYATIELLWRKRIILYNCALHIVTDPPWRKHVRREPRRVVVITIHSRARRTVCRRHLATRSILNKAWNSRCTHTLRCGFMSRVCVALYPEHKGYNRACELLCRYWRSPQHRCTHVGWQSDDSCYVC